MRKFRKKHSHWYLELQKFHTYLYGRRSALVTDHKPLTTVLGTENGILAMAAAHLQRWALLSVYTYDVEFKHTQDHANADGLSCLPQGTCHAPSTASAFVVGQIQALPVTAEHLASVTRQDPVLSKGHQFSRQGWPSHTCDDLKPF